MLYSICETLSQDESEEPKAVMYPEQSARISECMRRMNRLTMAELGVLTETISECTVSHCYEIYSCDAYQMALFIIPEGKNIQLHDHPNMTVLSKLLFGTLSVKSYDQSGPKTELGIPVRQPTIEHKYPSQKPWALSAIHNNYHEFHAVATSVIFEILFPPYNSDDRPCTYYEAYEPLGIGGQLYLRAIEPPDDQPVSVDS